MHIPCNLPFSCLLSGYNTKGICDGCLHHRCIFKKVKNMGQALKAQSIHVQNPTKLPFSNVDLV